jgi:lipopolysaccharide/colanic/teichoic acid biosynthesis glycosyltransferase
MTKRIVDVLLSSLGLLILFPLMLAIALVILVMMGWPVLFVQPRPGLGGQAFNLVKFRTMRTAGAADGSPLPDAVRLTRVGAFLRSTSLDELPELWNVLRGEMSLVGPRPLLVDYLPLYSPEQARRHEVRPGITGWAQVRGRNAITWEQRFELDVWYVEHHTLRLDLEILLCTIGSVLRREGITAVGEATMPRFRGNATDASR